MDPKSTPSISLAARLASPAALSIALVLAVLVLYWPCTGFEFSHHDDLQYYVQNAYVAGGIGWDSVVWAFKTGWASNWHPLTWISLMLDADLSGDVNNAWTPHFTNILLHALDSALLFLLLRQATQARWRSLLVAGLFAFHPLNVESVAWVAERKSVLSMLFFLLALLAYVKAVCETTGADRGRKAVDGNEATPDQPAIGGRYPLYSSRHYWISLFLFALALMSKPMVVTLPFILLLLDLWPLQRFELSSLRFFEINRLLLEKWPFFLLSVVACAITYLVQQHGHAVQSAAHFPLAGRLENAFVSYERYLEKGFWPVNLAIYYPHPGQWPVSTWLPASVLLILLSFGAVRWRRRAPYLSVGWFWFLGTLVPVIGLVQAGTQSMADRYAYLPLIGIFVAVVWSAADISQRIKVPCLVPSLAGAIIVLASATVTHHQLAFWQNDGTLFSHALAVTEDNPVAEVTLGTYLDRTHKSDEAMARYRRAIEIDPEDRAAHFDLANDLDDAGQPEAAIAEYRAALRIDPTFHVAAYNLGLLLERLGRRDEAIAEFKRVLQLKPGAPEAIQHLEALTGR